MGVALQGFPRIAGCTRIGHSAPPDWHPRVGSRSVWRKYLHRSPQSKATNLDNDDDLT